VRLPTSYTVAGLKYQGDYFHLKGKSDLAEIIVYSCPAIKISMPMMGNRLLP